MAMENAYRLRLGVASHHHRVLSSESHVMPRQDRQQDHQQDTERSLRFSVDNILKPDFGREAILNTKVPNESAVSAVIPAQHPRHSPLPRDLSLSSTRLSSPQSPQLPNYSVLREKDAFASLCGITSPLQKHSNGLSRSGSLESLASSRSSATSSSVASPPSLCSTSSTISGDSLNGENTGGSTSTSQQNGNNSQSLWPAWVYCTRYSDRPSSGKFDRYKSSFEFFIYTLKNIFHKNLIIM